jgi:hypothetical protein
VGDNGEGSSSIIRDAAITVRKFIETDAARLPKILDGTILAADIATDAVTTADFRRYRLQPLILQMPLLRMQN